MLVGFSQQDHQNWVNSMHGYEKQKRTKKPFGKDFIPVADIVKSQKIKQEQSAFNPILQKFKNDNNEQQTRLKQMKSRKDTLNQYYTTVGKRNMRNFDIINLHGNHDTSSHQRNFKAIGPIRNVYNPVNNQPLPQYYLHNRDVRLPHQNKFKSLKPSAREFNIVTNSYIENNQQKIQEQTNKKNKQIYEKCKNTRNYDPVYGRYYDPQKQKQYQSNLVKSQLVQSSGQQYNKRFPPIYLSREPLILDSTKPLTKSLIDIDQKKQNSKQRYKLKYLIQNQYQKRNMEHEQRVQKIIRNRVHNSHSMEQKAKQFNLAYLGQQKQDLINQIWGKNNNLSVYRMEDRYNPEVKSQHKINYSNYNQSSSNSGSRHTERSKMSRDSIKSGGFY